MYLESQDSAKKSPGVAEMVRKSKPPRNAVVDQDRTFSRSPADDDSNAPSSDHESQDEKDETEIELEKLVFGDDAGFRKNLRPPKAKSYGDEMSVGSESFEEHGSDQHDNEDLTALADADVGGSVVYARPCAYLVTVVLRGLYGSNKDRSSLGRTSTSHIRGGA